MAVRNRVAVKYRTMLKRVNARTPVIFLLIFSSPEIRLLAKAGTQPISAGRNPACLLFLFARKNDNYQITVFYHFQRGTMAETVGQSRIIDFVI